MVKSIHIEKRAIDESLIGNFDESIAKRVSRYHQGFPGYTKTDLVSLQHLSKHLGLNKLWIKDESSRFGLNAFKVLGGSYAVGRFIQSQMDDPPHDPEYSSVSEFVKSNINRYTIITATDGNHGRGVAYAAAQLGCRCIVYLPAGSAIERLENIRELGADASITDLSYDEAVQLAAEEAAKKRYVLIQDTAWKGYEQIPLWIMQGYMTMTYEADMAMDQPPTHIFLQAGVGSMAAAIAAYYVRKYGNSAPRIVIVEPQQADCFYQTAKANDGTLHSASGKLDSMMAGLCCGEPCSIAWEILKGCAQDYITITDDIAALGMRVLGCPLPGDPQIVSGESGASTTGLLVALMTDPELKSIRSELGITRESRVLCFSTEGATDRHNYYSVVWNGIPAYQY